MKPEIGELLLKVRRLEEEIETRVAHAMPPLFTRNSDGSAKFDQPLRERHRRLRIRLHHYVFGARAMVLITAPFIYLSIVPLVLLDLSVSLYQAACFPVYGIEKPRRNDYFVFDRAQLGYLNLLERFNCAYCSYANGLIAYVGEIASRTEQYWCPIKHARRMHGAHARYRNFLEYGDADAYRRELDALRRQLARCDAAEHRGGNRP